MVVREMVREQPVRLTVDDMVEVARKVAQASRPDFDPDAFSDAAARSVIEQFAALRDEIMRGRVFSDDSTELLQQAREERSRQLSEL